MADEMDRQWVQLPIFLSCLPTTLPIYITGGKKAGLWMYVGTVIQKWYSDQQPELLLERLVPFVRFGRMFWPMLRMDGRTRLRKNRRMYRLNRIYSLSVEWFKRFRSQFYRSDWLHSSDGRMAGLKLVSINEQTESGSRHLKYGWTEEQTYATDGQTEWQKSGRTDWMTEGRTDWRMDGRNDRRTDGLTDWRMDGRNDRRTDVLTNGRTEWQKDGWIDEPTDWMTEGRTDWRIDGMNDRRTDELTNRRTEWQKGGRTDAWTEWIIEGWTDWRMEGLNDRRTDGLTNGRNE